MLPRFVIPSAAEGSFSFPVSVFLRKAVCMKHRTPQSHEVRCFPFPVLLTASPDRKRKRFLAFARNDDAGKRLCYREGGFAILPPTGDTPKAMREKWQPSRTLPPSSGRRLRGAPEVSFRCGIEKEWEEAFLPSVILPCKTSSIHSV